MTVAKANGTTTPSATTNVIEKEKEAQSTRIDLAYDDDEDDIKLEDLAPDGGWGWMIALAMILAFATTIGPAASFTIVFGDFLEATGQAGAATTLFNSAFMITFSVAGLLTNALMKRYSMRPVGVFGALFYSVPNVVLALVDNVYQMAFICFIQGAGFGLIITICNTNFNAYFVKRRTQVMSAAQVIIAMAGIVYPIIIEKMMKAYGFRGTAAMTGALSLNCIVGMTMMHPVQWHSKDPAEVRAQKAREREERKLKELSTSNRRSTIDVIHASSKIKWTSLRSLKEESEKDVPLLVETLKTSQNRVASISGIDGEMRSRLKSGSVREPLTKKLSTLSATSLSNIGTGFGALGEIRQLQMERGSRRPTKERDANLKEEEIVPGLAELFEMSLVKNRGFLNICFGISFVLTSDFTFSSLLPLMMTNAGYSKSDAALTVTVSATAELISKILLAVFTLFVNVKARYIFFGAMICMTFARVGFLMYEGSLTGILVMTGVIGMVRSWLLVPQPLVIIEDVSIDKFASAYGIYAVISGITSIFFGPIVGFVKDWTDSFVVCQLVLLGMNALFIIPWAIQFLMVDLPKRRKERADNIAARSKDSFLAK